MQRFLVCRHWPERSENTLSHAVVVGVVAGAVALIVVVVAAVVDIAVVVVDDVDVS